MRRVFLFLFPAILFAGLEYTYDEWGRLKTIWSLDNDQEYSPLHRQDEEIPYAEDLACGPAIHKKTEIILPDNLAVQYIYTEDMDPFLPLLRMKGVTFTFDPFERLEEAVLAEKFKLFFVYDDLYQCRSQNFYEWEEGAWKLKQVLNFVYDGKEKVGAYYGFFETLGTALQWYYYHWVPFTGMRDLGIKTGEWLGAKPIPEEDTQYATGDIGVKKSEDKRVHVFINGILTNFQETVSYAKFISDNCDGEKVFYAYNATNGGIADLWEYFAQKLYIPTPAFQVALEAIKNALDDIGGVTSDGLVTIWAHSLGGFILERALMRLSVGERRRLQIFTFGSGYFFPKRDMFEVRHFLSTKDFMPILPDPYGYLIASWWDPSLIEMVPGGPGWVPQNHAFMGESYKNTILRLCQELQLKSSWQ